MKTNTKFILLILVIIAVLSVYFFYVNQKSIDTNLKDSSILSSREVMVYAEGLVKEKKPAPTESARVYAYVATAYYDVLTNASGTENKAEEAGKYFAENILGATSTVTLSEENKLILKDLLLRLENDGFKNTELGYKMPKGENFWIDRDQNPKTPFTPNAGKWERWNINDFNYEVPKPPKYNSEEYTSALEKVKVAAEDRTPEQGAAVNFWGGIPGTVQPSGIWQEVFFEKSKKHNLSNEEYSYSQMILAKVLADSFMECWKVKYTYWTKRPDMATNTINVAMPNPPFPSYVSGHSTISFAAATVLSELFPKDSESYLKDAEEAKNSRLWAGIHFPYDNEEGKKLGIAVGEYIIKKEDLKPLR